MSLRVALRWNPPAVGGSKFMIASGFEGPRVIGRRHSNQSAG